MEPANSSLDQLIIDRHEKSGKSWRWGPLVITGAVTAIACAYWIADTQLQAEHEHEYEYEQDSALNVLARAEAKTPALLNDSQAGVPPVNVNTGDEHQQGQENERVLDASGHIVARRIATVSSRITGKLEHLHIEEGQEVVADQLMAELDDQQAQISYQLAEAELDAKMAALEELSIAYQYQQQRLERHRELLRNQLISQQLADETRRTTEQMAAQLKNREAMISLAQKRLELAQYQLEQHRIRAPFDGVVISKNAQVGELISSGSSAGGFIRTGVGTIVDMDSLEIEVEVGESYINRVFAGQRAQARLDAYPQWQINSQVVAIIPTADRQKASIKVRIKLLETDPRILPDMGVKVSFWGQQQEQNNEA